MRAVGKKKTQWKEDLYLAVKLAQLKLSIYYTEVTPTTSMRFMPVHILDPFQKLRLFSKWDKGMASNPEDEKLYITQYKAAFMKYVQNEYCPKH
jgi:hypothetical protein